MSSRKLHGKTVGVPKEDLEGEFRVGLHPENIEKLVKKGACVQVERGAGEVSGFMDSAYEAAGATVVDKETSEVVRQIPDDVALKLAQDLQQSEPLSLFNAKV